MRRWLRHFVPNLGLPVLLLAVTIQILAPIGGVWLASAKASDPLAAVPICSAFAEHQSAPGDGLVEHHACCPLCAVGQAASLPDNSAAASLFILRAARTLLWTHHDLRPVAGETHGPAQARAPPRMA